MLKKLCAAAVLALPLTALAEGLSYKFVEADYVTVDADGGGEADGFAFGGSYLFTPQVYATAGYSSLSPDGASNVDFTTFSAALGLRHPLTSTLDANFEAGFVAAEIDAGSFGSEDDTGYSLAAGLRAMVASQLELNGGVNYVNVFDESETSVGVGAVYSFTRQFAAVVGADFGDEATGFNVGARFMF